MVSLKEVKGRINSVKSTRKITSAMRMVASAKLHKAERAINNIYSYRNKMNAILNRFLKSPDVLAGSPFSEERQVGRVALVVFSSNSSLCGAYNANVMRFFTHTVEEYKKLGKENILVYPVGKKIEEAVRKLGYKPQGSFQGLAEKPNYGQSAVLAMDLMDMFMQGKVDRVELIYHHFKSVGTQTLLRDQLLPIKLDRIAGEENKSDRKERGIDYIIEPSMQDFITGLLPQAIQLNMFAALLDSNASEHAARAIAMQLATENANGLIEELTKQYNKARQQTITNELQDIVGGSMR